MRLKFLQINAGKRINAASLLVKYVEEEEIDVVFIQEPYRDQKGIIKGLPRGQLIYKLDGHYRSRSCIWLKTGFEYSPLTQFCTMDFTAVLTDIKFGDEKIKIVLCSGYFDQTLDFPNEFKLLLEYCRKNNRQIIFGIDCGRRTYAHFW